MVCFPAAEPHERSEVINGSDMCQGELAIVHGTHWDGVNMVNKEHNCCNRIGIDLFAILLPFFAKLLVEFNKEKGLILHVCE